MTRAGPQGHNKQKKTYMILIRHILHIVLMSLIEIYVLNGDKDAQKIKFL